MGNSLRDQLLKAGLVDNKQVKRAVNDKHKKNKQQRQNRTQSVNEDRQRAQRAQAEKAERDRQLNRERQAAEAQKAVAAQIRQLIEANRQPVGDGDVPFNFVHKGKVKRLYASDEVRERISAGRLAIVALDGQYSLVAPDIAEKIRARNEKCLVLLNQPGQRSSDDTQAEDPYGEYKVPDDLMW